MLRDRLARLRLFPLSAALRLRRISARLSLIWLALAFIGLPALAAVIGPAAPAGAVPDSRDIAVPGPSLATARPSGKVLQAILAAGDPVGLVVVLPGETFAPGEAPGKTGEPEQVTIGQQTPVEIWAVDADWNLATDHTGTVALAVSDPLADLPPAVDLVGGTATVNVAWKTVGHHTLTATDDSEPSLVGSAELDVELFAHGLKAEYFNNIFLAPPADLIRQDDIVDFDWGLDSPAPEINDEGFSARWTGQVEAAFSETYTFSTISDDGVRLWVDDQLLIDNWTEHGPVWDSGEIDLEAGQTYSLRMEYFELGGGATAVLQWSAASLPEEVIPTEALSHVDLGNASAEVTPSSLVADNNETATLTIDLQNAVDLPMLDVDVYLNVSGSHNWINDTEVGGDEWVNIGSSDPDGQVVAELRSTVAETKTIHARVAGTYLDDAPVVDFDPGAPSQLMILVPGEYLTPGAAPGIGGEAQPIVVNRPSHVYLAIVDDNWNTVGSFATEVELVTTDPAADLPETVDIFAGDIFVSATWRTLGSHTLTATSVSDPSLWGEIDFDVVVPPDLSVGDGEVVTVDDVRYAMTGYVEEDQNSLPYDGTPGFFPGDTVLVVVMQGEGIGTFETALIDDVFDDELELVDDLENTYDGGLVRVMVQRVPEYGDVTVQAGGLITAHPWDGETGGVIFLRANNVTVEPGGLIDVSGLGFRAEEGPGSGGRRSGGGYGGYGGDDRADLGVGGVGYGSALEPIALGSAGGDYNPDGSEAETGGPGGGTLWLDVADMIRVDGDLRANGITRSVVAGSPGGGGAGGSLRLIADALAGSGVISATGGASYAVNFEIGNTYYGGGSGGRIAASFFSNTFTGAWRGWGGASGSGPGTIVLKDNQQGRTTLRVDLGTTGGRPAILTDPEATDWDFERIELTRNADVELIDPDDTIDLTYAELLGDGTGQIHLHYAIEFPEPELGGLGFYIHEDGELELPDDFTVRGAELSVSGTLAGPQDLVLADEAGRGAVVRLAASGHSSGQPLGTFRIDSVAVPDGSLLELASDPETERGATLVVNTLSIEAGGRVSGDGLGYPSDGDRGPGAPTGRSGAGHGGFGGGETGGTAYGSALEPTSLGSAGSAAGGGAVHIIADSLEVNGVLSSDGLPAIQSGGAGAGGSLWLEIGSLSGGGVIRADGGARYRFRSDSGSGGGGRISLAYTTNTFAGSLQAAGGEDDLFGGPGTIVLTDSVSGARTLSVDNLGRDGASAGLTDSDPTAWSFDQIALVGYGHLELLDPDDTILLTAANVTGDGTAVVSFHGPLNYAEPQVADFGFHVYEGGSLALPADFTIDDVSLTNEGSVSGTSLNLAGGTLSNHGLFEGISSLTIQGGSFFNDGMLDVGTSLRLASGGATLSVGRLTATGGTTGQQTGTYAFEQLLVEGGQRLELESDPVAARGVELIADQVTVQGGGRITADALGYQPDIDPGPGEGGEDGGGGHGGHGGGDSGGQPYGSATEPVDLGSAGWHEPDISFIHGLPGGGAIKIVSEAIQLDGIISANGVDSHDTREAGSAAGSIWLDVITLSGEGTLEANGGSSGGSYGAGSGGRVAVYLESDAFVGSIQAFGGESFSHVGDGGPGTIYLENVTTGDTELRVDNNGVEAPPAALLDPPTTTWRFDRIGLTRNGHLELYDVDDDILLSPANMVGDGTAMLFLHGDRAYTQPELTGFGFYVSAEDTLSLPAVFTLRGARMQVEGALDGPTDLTLTNNGEIHSTLALMALGRSVGQPVGTYAFGDVQIEAGQLLELIGDPQGEKGVVIQAVQMDVAGHVSADGTGYPRVMQGPGAPTLFSSGAGHGGVGGGSGGGPTYGSAEAPETLGSSGGGAGGGAIRLILEDALTVDATGVISADAVDVNHPSYGSGAGGSIWITAPQVLGQGSIRADGGDITNSSPLGSGGGGGRIKIEAGFTSTDLILTAAGGSGVQDGELGSVFVESVGFPADVQVVKTGPAEAIPGTTIEYTITARNEGQAPAEAVVLLDTLPADVTYVSDNAPVDVDQDGGILSWALGDMLPGERVNFAVAVRLSLNAGVGEQLVNQVSGETSSPDSDPANNVAGTSAVVVTGYRYTASLSPPSRTLGLGASGLFSIVIRNTGLLPDAYDVAITGLQADWYTLSESRATLLPGATAVLPLTVQVDDCGTTGQIPFSVNLSSDGGAAPQMLNGSVTLDAAPTIGAQQPGNGAKVGARDVLLQWRSDVPSVGLLTVYPDGQPEAALSFDTELGLVHSVLVTGLSRNTTYAWDVQATSACGFAQSQTRTFTVGNGIVFNSPTMSFEIDRDYDQRVPVQVTNQDNAPHTLRVEVDNPYDDLIINFVGSGSVDETVTLLPGQSRAVTLAIHAQDAVQREYDIGALLTADLGTEDPISDQATVHIRVLSEADYVIEETGFDPVTGTRAFRATNYGKTITDLEITAVDPSTGEPARVYIQPNITHARLATDETLTFEVIPVYGPEDIEAGAGAASPGAQGMASPTQAGIIPYELIGKAAGVIQRVVAQASCPEGKHVYPVTRGPVLMHFPASGWYCTNRPKIVVPFNIPAFVNPANVKGVRVRTGFHPKSEVRPHDTQVGFNGTQVGTLEDTVPSGMYEFDVPPEALRSGIAGTVQQEITIDSQHPNGGHYIVATDFDVAVALDSVTIYVCAGSQEEAEAIVDDLYDLIPLPTELSVSVNWPREGMAVEPEANGRINITSLLVDDLTEYFDYYSVQATIEYLDHPSIPAQTVKLFDDGNVTAHGDTYPKDKFFNTLWAPAGDGQVRLTVEASSPDGLTASDSITFTVEAQLDLAVKRIFQEVLLRENEQGEMLAEIANYGLSIDAPAYVAFSYYEADDMTGQPFGPPLVRAQCALNIEEEELRLGASVTVIDRSLLPERHGLYFAWVEVALEPFPWGGGAVGPCETRGW